MLYSLVLAHNLQAKFTWRRPETVLAKVWYTSLGKSSSCVAPLLWATEGAAKLTLAEYGGVSKISALSEENLLLTRRSTGIDLAFCC